MGPHIVVIDPGHGGNDPGAVWIPSDVLFPGMMRTRESDINLAVSHLLAQECLKKGLAPILTRHTNTTTSLESRVILANSIPASCVVSVHCNGHANPEANGFEVWTSVGPTPSDELATLLFESMARVLSDSQRRTDTTDGDVDKEGNLYMCRKTTESAVLLELGFISNALDRQLLINPTIQARLAESLATGIDAWIAQTIKGVAT